MNNSCFSAISRFLQSRYSCIISDPVQEKESSDYAAAHFHINGKKILYRQSKITPAKTGQFVTIWKRNSRGITEPFNTEDDFDYVMIHAAKEKKAGVFLFSKKLLSEQGIISSKNKNGKRGIRVYPAWDRAFSKQAIKTQQWQSACFIYYTNIQSGNEVLPENLFIKL